MATKVLVPRLGEGVEEVTITKWLKKEGDTIQELEPLLEVNTDKVDTEVPAPASGILLKIEVPEGQPARVGQLLAWIGQTGELVEGEKPPAIATTRPQSEQEASSPPAPATPTSAIPEPAPQRDLGFISPVVARLAAEHGIDLSQVPGTGLHGRITKKDVLDYLERRRSAPAEPVTPAAPPPPPAPSPTPAPAPRGRLIPHTLMRKQIAEHMVHSKSASPHVLTVMEADLSQVIKHRQAHKAAFERDGVNLTFTAYFMMAIVAALKAYPIVNSSWTDEGILIHQDINLGMAVSLGEDGLIVPVIKQADALSLLGMARAVNDLAQRARARKLQPEDVKGGTFTLTNHGTGGSLFAMPIINQPQCGILGVGAIHKRPLVVTDADGNDAIAIRPVVYLSFVFDHRILDGAVADGFLAKVKQTLENWT